VADAFVVEVVPPAECYHVPPLAPMFDRFAAAGYRAFLFDKAKTQWLPATAADVQGWNNVLWRLDDAGRTRNPA
jgi:hypothetical protein